MAKSPPDKVMTIEELSKYLKISRSTLYKLAQEGKLPAQKVGRYWRFRKTPWIGGSNGFLPGRATRRRPNDDRQSNHAIA